MKIRTNLLSGIIFSLLSIALILITPKEVPVPAFDNGGPSPRVLPYIVLSGTLICSILLIIKSIFFKKEKIFEFDIDKEKSSFINLAIMIFFGTIMVKFGFIVSVIIGLPIMLYSLGERKPFIYIFTVFLGIGVYYMFIKIFNISLPPLGGA